MKTFGVTVGIIGAFIMIIAGVDMMRIVSQSAAGGSVRSVAEVFYNSMGLGFIGLGVFCIMLICIVAFRETHSAADKEEREDK